MENNTKNSVVEGIAASVESTGGDAFFAPQTTGDSVQYVGADSGQGPVTAAEVERIVRAVFSEMKIYVVESDITDAQNAVKAVVEQSRF